MKITEAEKLAVRMKNGESFSLAETRKVLFAYMRELEETLEYAARERIRAEKAEDLQLEGHIRADRMRDGIIQAVRKSEARERDMRAKHGPSSKEKIEKVIATMRRASDGLDVPKSEYFKDWAKEMSDELASIVEPKCEKKNGD